MSFPNNNILRLAEDAVIGLLDPLIEGLNYLNSTNNTEINRPALIVTASNAQELMGPFTGIYDVSLELRYEAKLDDTTKDLASSKFQEILQAMYYDTKLGARLTAVFSSGFTCQGVKHIGFQELPPDDQERLWIKTIDLHIVCMPRS